MYSQRLSASFFATLLLVTILGQPSFLVEAQERTTIGKDLVALVTTNVKEEDPPLNGKITFNIRDAGPRNDTTTLFIKDIEVKDGVLTATKVNDDDDLIKDLQENHNVFFAMHGLSTPADIYLDYCTKVQVKLDDNTGKVDFTKIVPVIWPSLDGGGLPLINPDFYKNVQGNGAKGASQAFKGWAENASKFKNKSLMMESMGNEVFRYAADEKFGFDNLFMAAADVPNDIFAGDDQEGNNIIKSLKKGGKVYVLHNPVDWLLWISSAVNAWEPSTSFSTVTDVMNIVQKAANDDNLDVGAFREELSNVVLKKRLGIDGAVRISEGAPVVNINCSKMIKKGLKEPITNVVATVDLPGYIFDSVLQGPEDFVDDVVDKVDKVGVVEDVVDALKVLTNFFKEVLEDTVEKVVDKVNPERTQLAHGFAFFDEVLEFYENPEEGESISIVDRSEL